MAVFGLILEKKEFQKKRWSENGSILAKKMGFGDMEEKINQNNSSSSYKENESSNEINIWELIMKPT